MEPEWFFDFHVIQQGLTEPCFLCSERHQTLATWSDRGESVVAGDEPSQILAAFNDKTRLNYANLSERSTSMGKGHLTQSDHAEEFKARVG